MLLVVLVGMPGSGKSTIGKNLSAASERVNWIRSREIVQQLSGASTTPQIQTGGLNFTKRSESEEFMAEVARRMKTEQINIFDSVRPRAHWDAFVEIFGERVTLVSVDAPKEIRANRLSSKSDPEKIEDRDDHLIEKDVPGLMRSAELRITNSGEIREACYSILDGLFQNFMTDEHMAIMLEEILERLSEHGFSV